MKKFFLSLVIMIMATAAVRSQTLTDSASLRAYINFNIVTNGSKQITAVMLNRILSGYLNMWPRYAIDSLRESNDSIYARKNKVWSFVFKASAGGSPGGAGNTFQYNNEGAFAGAADFMRTETDGLPRYGIGYQEADWIPGAKLNITGDTAIGETDQVTNGTFTGSASGWTLDGMTYGSNMISGVGSALVEESLVEGDNYILSFDIVGGDELGSVNAYLGAGVTQSFTSIGTHSLSGVWSQGMGFSIAFVSDAEFTGSIDNVSVFPLTISPAAIFDGNVTFNSPSTFVDKAIFNEVEFNASHNVIFHNWAGAGNRFLTIDNDGIVGASNAPHNFFDDNGDLSGTRTIGMNNEDLYFVQGGTTMFTITGNGSDRVIARTAGGAIYWQEVDDVAITAPDKFVVQAARTSYGAEQSTFFGINDGSGVRTYFDVDTLTSARHVKIGPRGSGTNNVWLDFDDAAGGAYFHGGLFNIGDANLFAGNLMGYTSGTNMGGNVNQATSKSTAVTNNKYSGTITMNNASLAANTSVSFTFNNATLSGNARIVLLNILSGGTAGAYQVSVGSRNSGGSCTITLTNVSGGSLGEAVVIQFMVLAAVL